MALLPDLIPFFSSYGSYHNNTVNKIIHIFCIPTIVFSLLGLLHHVTFHFKILSSNPIFEVNLQFFFILFVTMAYMLIDFPSGLISHLFYTALVWINNFLYYRAVQNGTTDDHFKTMFMIQILAWVLQFIERAPALFDNLLQTLVAPDFVVLEIMFHFGYRHADYIKIKKQIHNNINEFKQSKIKKN